MNTTARKISESILWNVWIDVFRIMNEHQWQGGKTRVVQTTVEMMQARQFSVVRPEIMNHA